MKRRERKLPTGESVESCNTDVIRAAMENLMICHKEMGHSNSRSAGKEQESEMGKYYEIQLTLEKWGD